MFPDTTALAEIGIAVARAYMPDAGLWDWAKMTWDMVVPPPPAEAGAGAGAPSRASRRHAGAGTRLSATPG